MAPASAVTSGDAVTGLLSVTVTDTEFVVAIGDQVDVRTGGSVGEGVILVAAGAAPGRSSQVGGWTMGDSRLKKTGSQLALVVATCLVTVTLAGGGPAGAFSVPNNSVTSAKIVNNSIQSIDIKDRTIGRQDIVPGQRIFPINHRSGNVTSAGVVTVNGITIRVTCSGGVETITVTKTATVNAEISAISNDAGAVAQVHGFYDDDFTAGETFAAGPGAFSASERQYTLTYSAADGKNVTATFVTEDSLGGNDCNVSGYAVG